MRQGAPAESEQLRHVVKLRRVALAGDDDGKQPLEPTVKLGGLQLATPRLHPVGVSAQRVDLAIVRDVAKRLRQIPGRKGIGGEPRMHHRDRRHHVGRLQVEKELRQLPRQQQALVNDGLVGQAGDVEIALGIDAAIANAILGKLANHVQRALVR
jgi:hypothetical protein